MAATNLLDGLDPALIREGRFDLRIRVDLPDEAARRKILESLLSGKPSKVSDMGWLAARTPGFSAAKLRTVVDRAAVMAAESRRKIEEQDLRAALDAMGGKDRPLLEPVQWRDVVIDAETEQELRELIGLLNDPDSGREWKIHPPTGVLLVGPPGTGKSLLARLIATQTRRSFYPIVASDVLGGQVGESVKKLSGVFERARDNRPSIIFFDEIDGCCLQGRRFAQPARRSACGTVFDRNQQPFPSERRFPHRHDESPGPDRPAGSARRAVLREDSNLASLDGIAPASLSARFLRRASLSARCQPFLSLRSFRKVFRMQISMLCAKRRSGLLIVGPRDDRKPR